MVHQIGFYKIRLLIPKNSQDFLLTTHVVRHNLKKTDHIFFREMFQIEINFKTHNYLKSKFFPWLR